MPAIVIENLRFFVSGWGSGSIGVGRSWEYVSSGTGTVWVEVELMTLLLSPQEKLLGLGRAMETFSELFHRERKGVCFISGSFAAESYE